MEYIEQQKALQELKFKLKMTTEDKGYFEDFVLAAKKENKVLKEELMQFELGKKTIDNQFATDYKNRRYSNFSSFF